MASKNIVKAINEFAKDFQANMKTLSPAEMVYYGQFVNEGTYKMAAQPFINDAWAETRFDSQVDEAILDEIEDMFDVTFKPLTQ